MDKQKSDNKKNLSGPKDEAFANYEPEDRNQMQKKLPDGNEDQKTSSSIMSLSSLKKNMNSVVDFFKK